MSYDTWKTTDAAAEHGQELVEECEKLFDECPDCKESNFENMEILQIQEERVRKFRWESFELRCKMCEEEFEVTNEPDWDRMRDARDGL